MSSELKFGELIHELPKSKRLAKDAKDSGTYPFFVCSATAKRSDYADYAKEAIILSTGGSAYTHYCNTKFSASGDTWVLATDQSRLDTKYAYYYLEHRKKSIQEEGFQGSGLKHLQKDFIRNMDLLLPSLPEQKKIAEILSSVSSLRLAHSQELERICLVKKAFETYFLHASSESVMGVKTMQSDANRVQLEEVASFSQGVQVGVENHFSRMEAGMTRFLRISDYTKDDEPPRYIDSSFAIKGIVSPDDIVMIRYGEAGRVCRGIQGAIANNLFTITPESGISKEYLFMYLSSSLIQEQLKAMTTSTAMPAINFKQLGQIEIKLIDIDTQDAICARLRSVNQKIDFLSKKIQHLEQLNQAISDDLLSGRKRVSV
jgi:type I restriction enzyme, S subunit